MSSAQATPRDDARLIRSRRSWTGRASGCAYGTVTSTRFRAAVTIAASVRLTATPPMTSASRRDVVCTTFGETWGIGVPTAGAAGLTAAAHSEGGAVARAQ